LDGYNIDGFVIHPELAAGMQIVLRRQVLFRGAIGVGLGADVIELAAELLRADVRGVREQGNSGYDLAGSPGSAGVVE
jgi:hypothetical protein